MECDENDEALSDSVFTKKGISLWINNQPKKAIELLEKRKYQLTVSHGYVLLNFVNAVISFDSEKIEEVRELLRDLEKRCASNFGWLKSIKSKLFGSSVESDGSFAGKSILKSLEEQIILAETQLCLAILVGISQDISGIVKAGWLLRKAWKVYETTYTHIYDIYNKSLSTESLLQDPIHYKFSNINNNNDLLMSPMSEVSNAWTVPSSLIDIPDDECLMVKSRTTDFSSNNSSAYHPSTSMSMFSLSNKIRNLTKRHDTYRSPSKKSLTSDYNLQTRNCCDNNIDANDFEEIRRLVGAVNFGYGIFQLCISLLPPHILKLISLFGFQGDRKFGINCLKLSRLSTDFRSPLAAIALLWYYSIVVPFFSLEDTDLSFEINAATELLDELSPNYQGSALFLFFSGRVQRLMTNISNAVLCYEDASRAAKQRELKILCMHELGWCLLIELNFPDALHYFSELKTSKFSQSFYLYLCTLCCGSVHGSVQEMDNVKKEILSFISVSSQKDGIIEKFIHNRCLHALPEEHRDSVYWKLLVYEMLLLWNSLTSCSLSTLNLIIEECNVINCCTTAVEPFCGLGYLLMGNCYTILKQPTEAIKAYRDCINKCLEFPEEHSLQHVPANANYDLAILLLKDSENDNRDECKQLLQTAHNYKNHDFEHRLKLKISNRLRTL